MQRRSFRRPGRSGAGRRHFFPGRAQAGSSPGGAGYARYISQAADQVEQPESVYDESKKYADFALHQLLQRNIAERGYVHPTRIQSQVIPAALEGKDVLAMARTGSGKTAAFLLPMLNKVIMKPQEKVLVLSPTRELAQQTEAELRSFARASGIRSAVIIGGTSMGKQIADARRNPNLYIATPGRLKDLYERRVVDLSQVHNLVLDEVDRMLDMGFVHDIRFIISKMPEQKQSMFLSATMPYEAERIATELLKDPVRIEVKEAVRQQNIEQKVVHVPHDKPKLEVLDELIRSENMAKILIFSRTKHGADRLSRKLDGRGFKVDSIHGDKSQARRSRVIEMFRRNEINILVATDVAARGIDISDITHVINYDEPGSYEDYTHRIGRTGRIGKKGYAYTFVG